MPVDEVKSGVRIGPNRVHAILPNTLMSLAEGIFKLMRQNKGPRQHPDLTVYFAGLSTQRKTRKEASQVAIDHWQAELDIIGVKTLTV
jgi:hypothetical protein